MDLWGFLRRYMGLPCRPFLEPSGRPLVSPTQQLTSLETHLKRNATWVDAALDVRDQRSFILAVRERARLKRALEMLLNGGSDG